MSANLNYIINLDAETRGMQRAASEWQNFLGSLKAGIAIDIGGRLVSGIAGIEQGFKSAALAGIDFKSKIEDLATSYRTLLGSSDAANMRIEELAKFAATTPFELPGIGKANKILETMTRGALSGQEGMKLVGDAAAVADAPIEELAVHIGRLYDALTTGRKAGESLMRLQELGIVSGEVRNKIESLQATGAKGPEVWNVAATALGRFAGEMERRSQTFSGRLSTLRDAWNAAMGEMMAGAVGASGTGFQELTKALEDPATVQSLREMGVRIRQVVEELAKLSEWAVKNGPQIVDTITMIGKAWATYKISNIVSGGLQSMAGGIVGIGGAGAAAGAGGTAGGAAGAPRAGGTSFSGVLGAIGIGLALGSVVNDLVSRYAAKVEAEGEAQREGIKSEQARISEIRRQLSLLDSVASKKALLLKIDQDIEAAQVAGNAGLAAKLGRARLDVAGVDDATLDAREKTNIERKAKEQADLNARVNRKALDKLNLEIAQDKSAFQEQFMGASPAEQISLARKHIEDLRKEQAASNPESNIGLAPEEFAEKAQRYKALYSEITAWEQRLVNMQKAETRSTDQARKATLRDLRGQSYRDLLSGITADQRVGLLSSQARAVIGAGGGVAEKANEEQLKKIREGIDRLVEINKQKAGEESTLFAD